MGNPDSAPSNAEEAIQRVQRLGGAAVCERELCAVSLSDTAIRDDDLAVLEYLPMVEILDLSRTSITDAGIRHLEGLRKLQTLSLSGTKVSLQGTRRLRKALGSIEIIFDPPPIEINPL